MLSRFGKFFYVMNLLRLVGRVLDTFSASFFYEVEIRYSRRQSN